MHNRRELEAHLEKGRLSCDSDAPQVESAQSVSARVVKVNCRKIKQHKTRPYCTWKSAEHSSLPLYWESR
jgi:hypothetical protein